ncbi:MAG: InlB B-repeat-containing protein, partial [Oscillospiraceae bacterium]|nr:InlB B-repeat-containing protein [Oscillospiraceae bacterium]
MRKTKKLLAILLCFAMCFSLLPTWAFAEEADLQEQGEPAVTETAPEEAEEQQEEDAAEPDAGEILDDPAEEIPEPAEELEEPAQEEEAEIEVAGDPDEGDIEPLDDPDGVAINAENFPDDTFRALVSTFDTDPEDEPDGILSEDEIAEVTEIVYEGTEITDLTGIEFFTELEVLIYGDDGFGPDRNPLSSLNLSNNTMLKTLSLQNTSITALDVTALGELERLYVGFTGISELNLSQNSLLEDLICNDTNISSLDLSHNPELWKLDCCGSPLTVLNISACPYLVDQYENEPWTAEEMDEYDGDYNYLAGKRVFGYDENEDGRYTFAVSDYTEIVCEAPDLFAEFKAACENEWEDFDLSDLGEFTIEESLTIPRNMFADAWGTTIIIPAGVTLTVEGKLSAESVAVECEDEDSYGILVVRGYAGIGSLEVDGTARFEDWADNNIEDISGSGSIELKNDWLNIPAQAWTDDVEAMISYKDNDSGVNIHLDAEDEYDIANAPEIAQFTERVRPNIHVLFAWAPDSNFSFPEEVSFHIEADGNLTVPAEVSFEVNGYLGLHGSDAAVEGTLINNGKVELMDNKGTVSHLTLANGGSYEGFGEIEIRTPCTPEGSLVGFNLDDFVIIESDEYHIRGRFADMEEIYESFRAACEDKEDYFNLRDFGEFTIQDDLTIPDEMYVEGWGTTIVIPAGVTLTVNGSMDAENVEVRSSDAGGEGILLIHGNMNVNGISGTGSIELKNGWLNIPVEVWTDDVEAMVSFVGDNCGVNIHLDAENEEDIANAPDAAPIAEHVRPNIHVKFAWAPEDDFTVPEEVSFHFDGGGSLTVPEEVSFEVNGYLGLHGADVTVEGTFINNGDVELMEEGAPSHLILDGGEYQGSGRIRVRTSGTLEEALVGFDLDDFLVWEEGDEICARFVDVDALYEEFRQACEDKEGYFELCDYGEFTIQDDLTIPKEMHVEAWGTTIIVPDDVTLTVEGQLNAEGLAADGTVILDHWANANFNELSGSGSVVIRNAWLNLPLEVWYDAGDLVEIDKNCDGGVNINLEAEDEADVWDDLETALDVAEDRVHPNIHIRFDWTLEDDFSFPGGINFQIEREGSLTIPEGTGMEANGSLGIRGSVVTVGGTLINNGNVELTENGGTDPRLVLDGGSYQGTGEIRIEHPYTPETVLSGFDMNLLTMLNEDGWGCTWLYGSVFSLLKAAIVNGPDEDDNWYFRIPDEFTLTISENLTIPAGMNIDGWSAKIIVPKGVTLTLEGSANFGAMEIAGTVRVADNASVSIEGLWNENGLAETVSTTGTGVLKLEGTQSESMVPMAADLSGVNIQYLYGAKLKLSAQAHSGAELAAVLDAFRAKSSENYRAFIEVLAECVLTGDLEIPSNAEVLVISAMNTDIPWDNPPGSIAGSLTIPSGVTLTVNGFLGLYNTEIIIQGTLFNNAQMNLEPAYGRYGECGYLILDGGSYKGTGNIWVPTPDDPESHLIGIDTELFHIDWDYNGANFRLRTFGMTYDVAGASGTQPDARFDIPFGEEVLLAPQGDLTKEGFVFGGWYNVMTDTFYRADELDTPVADLNVRKDNEGNPVEFYDFVVLGAAWNRDGYVVRFDGNGADSGSMEDQVPVQYDQYQDGYRVFLEPNAFERVGYTFIGWNTRADGSGRSYCDRGIVNLSPELLNGENGLVLYAQWKQEEAETFKIFNIESGKKLDLAKVSAISGASWSVIDGGQYAALTVKGALTAKAVTELQTVYVEAINGDDVWLIEVNIFPAATAVQINCYSGELPTESAEGNQTAFDEWDNWEQTTNGQIIYVPYDGTHPVEQALQAIARPDDAMQGEIVWTSSDKGKIVDLDGRGGFGQLVVRPKAAGTVTLTATCGKVKATVKLVIGSFIPDISVKTTDAKGNPIFATWTSSRTGAEYPAVRGGSTVTLQADYDRNVKYADSGLIWELVDWAGTDDDGNDIWVPAENPYARITPTGKLTTSVL